MFNKLNTKVLIGIFAALLLIALFAILRNKSESAASRDRSFKSELTDFDSSAIDKLIIFPKNKSESIELRKTDNNWFVIAEDAKFNADHNTIKTMLANLLNLRATRIAATSKSSWEKYEVTDSAATHVLAYIGNKVAVDVYIGKFSYQQPKNQNPYMQQQQQGKMSTYIRLGKDKETYAVNGFLSMMFNRQSDDFRNRSIVSASKDQWTRINFSGPQETYKLTKQGIRWMIDGLEADSVATVEFLNGLSGLYSSDFIEPSVLQSDKPAYSLTIEGENMGVPIKVYAFEADTSNVYAISSSQNQGSYFSGSKAGLFEKIFPGKDSFFKNENITDQ